MRAGDDGEGLFEPLTDLWQTLSKDTHTGGKEKPPALEMVK